MIHATRPILRRGFSLIELLMAIFILGIGLISIAALFPAGVLLQQRAEDELNGPLVAAHAIELIRSRLSPDDFGSWWDYMDAKVDWDGHEGAKNGVVEKLFNERANNPASWLARDTWPWMRPAMVVSSTNGAVVPGSLDIFNATEWNNEGDTIGEHTLPNAHPWKRFLSFDPYGDINDRLGIPCHSREIIREDANGIELTGEPDMPYLSVPEVFILPGERQWPLEDQAGRTAKYFWDCVFRRVGGTVQVGVFVYRVQKEAASTPPWSPQPIVASGDVQRLVPPVPWVQDLNDPDAQFGSWEVGMAGQQFAGQYGTDPLPGAASGDAFDPNDPAYGWQWPSQYLLDQYGSIHRVASGRTRQGDNETPVSLSAPVPSPLVLCGLDRTDLDQDYNRVEPQLFTASSILPAGTMDTMSRPYHFPQGLVLPESVPVVDRLWYVPPRVTTEQGLTYRLIPVYATVSNL